MQEAQAHRKLKQLLSSRAGSGWPHGLTLTRLVARSLRRCDHSLFPIREGQRGEWLLSLLLPAVLSEAPVALIASQSLRRRILQQELPLLRSAGLVRPLWQGTSPPAGSKPAGAIALAGAIKNNGALASLNLSQNDIPESETSDFKALCEVRGISMNA